MSTLTGPSEQAVAVPDDLNGYIADSGEHGRGLSYCPPPRTSPNPGGANFHDNRHGQQTNPTARHLWSAVPCGLSSETDSLIRQAGSMLLRQVSAGQRSEEGET
jgi:hypothetical protein